MFQPRTFKVAVLVIEPGTFCMASRYWTAELSPFHGSIQEGKIEGGGAGEGPWWGQDVGGLLGTDGMAKGEVSFTLVCTHPPPEYEKQGLCCLQFPV